MFQTQKNIHACEAADAHTSDDACACSHGPSVSKENCLNAAVVEQIYKRNPILRHTHHPLHSPLLPLPYGDISLSRKSRTLPGLAELWVCFPSHTSRRSF